MASVATEHKSRRSEEERGKKAGVEAGDTITPPLEVVPLQKVKESASPRRDFEQEALVLLTERGYKLGPKLGKVCITFLLAHHLFFTHIDPVV